MANDVQITLFNQTGDDQTFVVFQQDPTTNQIFSKVFPTAWRVFNVGATGGKSNVKLPLQYQIGAGDTNDAFTGQVSNTLNTNTGKQWEFSMNDTGHYVLAETGNQADGSIACLNATGQYVTMSLVKNEMPLLTYPQIGNGALATFMPISYIYIAWYNNIVQGAQIKAAVSQPQALGVNLDGAKTIEGTLTKNSNTGQLTWAIKVNGMSTSPSAEAVGLRPAFSITHSHAEALAMSQR